MLPEDEKKLFTKKVIRNVIAYAAVFFALILIAYYTEFTAFLLWILNLLRPVLIGLALAYLCNPLFCFLERKVFFRLRLPALRRALSLLCTYVLIIAVIALLLALILPQLFQSIVDFVNNYEKHVSNAVDNINGIFYFINDSADQLFNSGDIFEPINNIQFFGFFQKIFSELMVKMEPMALMDFLSTIFSFITDFIFAIFISIYLLASKEKRYSQVMKLRHALFSDKTNKRITKLCSTADRSFGKFLEGKLLDSVIVGVLTYIVTSLFGIPYAILIATITAIFNIIPIIGFLASLVPSALLILLTNPEKLLAFFIIMFIIYQLEVNIISPKILGNNTGLSAMWVIIAISITGTLWGFAGMILGVPLFATILELSDTYIHRRLQKKRMPDDVENYYAPDPIIDPSRSIVSGSGKLIKQLEKRVLHARSLIDSGHEERLKRIDRMALRTYAVARKLRILKPTPPDILTQFAAEEAERNLIREAKGMREELSKRSFLQEEIPNDDPASVAEKGE